jgi:FO synthase
MLSLLIILVFYVPAAAAAAAVSAGDKPEVLYPEAAAELKAMGYSSTLEYVEAAAWAVLQQTGLLPHINAGVVGKEELAR